MAGRVRGIMEKLLGRRREIALSDVVSDTDLLQRFAETRDEAAFELLVWRHGTMVLGVCRRAVRDEHLAEDAFQAVFIVLARKADAIREGNIGGWLFRVARRVAACAAQRRPLQHALVEVLAAPQLPASESYELTAILDAEVARLPERLRRPVILCYLGDRSTEDAARELGCPRGTILSRLATARKRLAERLTRRGVTALVIGAAIAERTTGRLVSQTIATVQNPFLSPAASAPAILAESVVHAMTMTKVATAMGVVLIAMGLSASVGLVAAGTGEIEPALPDATVRADRPTRQFEPIATPQDAKPADRTATFREQATKLDALIRELQARIAKDVMDADHVDVAVLQAELFTLDKDILETEKKVKHSPGMLESAIKNREAAARKMGPDKDLIANQVDQVPAVREGLNQLNKAEATAKSLQKKLGPDHPNALAARQEVVDAIAAVKAAREKALPEVERNLRAETERNFELQYDRPVKEAERLGKLYAEILVGLRDDRRKLVERIANAKLAEAKGQALQDELRIYREIQLELLRQRTLADLGHEMQPMVRPAIDPKVEAQLRDLKRELEALRAEVERLLKKNQ